MTKEELLAKYPKRLLEDVAFIEDSVPNYPLIHKYRLIRGTDNAYTQEEVENALRDYQSIIYK